MCRMLVPVDILGIVFVIGHGNLGARSKREHDDALEGDETRTANGAAVLGVKASVLGADYVLDEAAVVDPTAAREREVCF